MKQRLQKIITHEWEEIGRRLYGDNEFEWKFICPVCGNIQTPNDFKPYKDSGATPSSAYQECIGRYLPVSGRASELALNPASKTKQNSPCDYAAYGFFRLGPVCIRGIRGVNGHETEDQYIFGFADWPEFESPQSKI